MLTIRNNARRATGPLAYIMGLSLAHYAARSISHAYAMRASDRFSPKPFPTYELCRDHNGQVTCNRARAGIGEPCQERCLILQQREMLSKSSPSLTSIRDRATHR